MACFLINSINVFYEFFWRNFIIFYNLKQNNIKILNLAINTLFTSNIQEFLIQFNNFIPIFCFLSKEDKRKNIERNNIEMFIVRVCVNIILGLNKKSDLNFN